MADRFPSGLTVAFLAAVLAAAGCEQAGQHGVPGSGAATQQARQQTEAEQLLAQRSAAMQRTMLEASGGGALAGAAAGYATFGLVGALVGAAAGGGGGAAGGNYVGNLQRDYADEERRLERVAADLDLANADAEAVLEAMGAVLAQQQAEIATIRARIATDSDAQALLSAELEDLQRNVGEMQGAIAGADRRLADARQARSVLPKAQAEAAVDPRIGELGRRIAAMRDIADTLAQGA